MNSYTAETSGKQSIHNALVAAGCVDGITLKKSEIKTETDIIFWHQRPPVEGGEKKTYITYEVVMTPEETDRRADNKAAVFSFEASIDIWTRLRLNDKKIKTLIENIVEQLEIEEFIINMGPDIFENDTGISHKPIEISKEIL